MNALNLYITTCRRILQPSADDNLMEIDRTLSYLRQALSCCVCGHLLMIPMTSMTSQCQHSVCKACVGGKMKLKPSCSWCKDYNQYGENTHIRILLQLYKKLCQYCITAGLQRKFGDVNVSTNTNFANLVQEGAAIGDEYSYKEKELLSLSSLPKDGALEPLIIPPTPHTMNGEAKEIANGVYSVTVSEDNSNKIMIKRTAMEGADLIQGNETPPKRLRTNSIISSKPRKKRGCRCGMATPNPGKLTCCGQRCPCYVESKACFECRCRGCRNPNKSAEAMKDSQSPVKDLSPNRRDSRSNDDASGELDE